MAGRIQSIVQEQGAASDLPTLRFGKPQSAAFA